MSTVLKTTTRLTGPEAEFATRLKMSDTDEAAALRALTGLKDPAHAPLATLVGAIIDAGIIAIKEKADEVARVRLAEHLKTDQEHQAWHNSRRRRNAARMAQEAA